MRPPVSYKAALLSFASLLLVTLLYVTYTNVNLEQEQDQKFLSKSELPNEDPPIQLSEDLAPTCKKSEERLFFVELYTVNHGSGLGNFIFEMISFLGISKALGRTPAFNISNFHYNQKVIYKQRHYFPNLLDRVVMRKQENAVFVKHPFEGSAKYTDFQEIFGRPYKEVPRIASFFRMMQSFKHFESLSREEVLSVFEFLPQHVEIAKTLIVPDVDLKKSHNLCVHVRRGDFYTSPMEMSRENSTIAGMKFVHKIVSKKYKNVQTIIVGNDHKWERKIVKLGNFNFPVEVGAHSRAWPPHIDWIFSSLYCDTIYLTAAASTYGWWLSYFSRGQSTNQTTYYLEKMYKKPKFERARMTKETFFPNYFTPIDFDKETGTVDFAERVNE